MDTLISQLIRSFHGYVYESAGVINGFFDDPRTARDCARQIKAQFNAEVEVCGCRLVVSSR